MRTCGKCDCPLTCLAGEQRRVCVRCRAVRDKAASNRVYYAARRDDLLRYSAERYARQREVRLLQAAAYYMENREVILAKKRHRDAAAAASVSEAGR